MCLESKPSSPLLSSSSSNNLAGLPRSTWTFQVAAYSCTSWGTANHLHNKFFRVAQLAGFSIPGVYDCIYCKCLCTMRVAYDVSYVPGCVLKKYISHSRKMHKISAVTRKWVGCPHLLETSGNQICPLQPMETATKNFSVFPSTLEDQLPLWWYQNFPYENMSKSSSKLITFDSHWLPDYYPMSFFLINLFPAFPVAKICGVVYCS